MVPRAQATRCGTAPRAITDWLKHPIDEHPRARTNPAREGVPEDLSAAR